MTMPKIELSVSEGWGISLEWDSENIIIAIHDSEDEAKASIALDDDEIKLFMNQLKTVIELKKQGNND